MFQAFKYPWRMPRGSSCHVKVLSFTVALMPFLNGLCSALGGNRLQRDANTKITDLGPRLKFMKRFQCPWVSLCHDHTISVVYFTAKGVGKSLLFMLYFFLIPSFFVQPWSCLWPWNPGTTLFIYSGVMNLLK